MITTLHEDVQHVFHRPLWRKLVPLVLLLLLWGAVLLVEYAGVWFSHPMLAGVLAALAHYRESLGVSSQRLLVSAGGISLVLLFWFYLGFEKLIVDSLAIRRRLPLGLGRGFRWSDLDEVLIEHVESRFEGKSTAKKTLILYARPWRFMPFRRRMKITNREFECYHHVERLASQVSIPAIAARKRQEIEEDEQIALFPMRESGDAVLAVLLGGVGFALIPVWGLDTLWSDSYAYLRPYALALGIVLLLVGLRKFLFRQIGIDRDNIYIMRRQWVVRKIPIESITDVRVLDNRMRILARVGKARKERQVFKTSRFIRNRGVLLRLIREMYDARRLEHATPIVPLAALPVEPDKQRPQEPNGPVRVIQPDAKTA